MLSLRFFHFFDMLPWSFSSSYADAPLIFIFRRYRALFLCHYADIYERHTLRDFRLLYYFWRRFTPIRHAIDDAFIEENSF